MSIDLNGGASNRQIPTGGLRFDGNPVSIELNHETCQYMVSGDDGRTGICYNLGKLPLIATDKGIVLREIKEALAGGRKVTADTEKMGKTKFEKVGRSVIGRSSIKDAYVPKSVGIFGLSKVLGLKNKFGKIDRQVELGPQG